MRGHEGVPSPREGSDVPATGRPGCREVSGSGWTWSWRPTNQVHPVFVLLLVGLYLESILRIMSQKHYLQLMDTVMVLSLLPEIFVFLLM